jgi:hypothetical protein
MPLDVKLTNPANPKDFRYIERAALARDFPGDPTWIRAEKQRLRGGAAAVTRAAATRRPTVPQSGKSLPPVPRTSGLHPLQMDQRSTREEFDALYDWVKAVDTAPGRFTPRQEIKRDEIAERVDLLRRYAFA